MVSADNSRWAEFEGMPTGPVSVGSVPLISPGTYYVDLATLQKTLDDAGFTITGSRASYTGGVSVEFTGTLAAPLPGQSDASDKTVHITVLVLADPAALGLQPGDDQRMNEVSSLANLPDGTIVVQYTVSYEASMGPSEYVSALKTLTEGAAQSVPLAAGGSTEELRQEAVSAFGLDADRVNEFDTSDRAQVVGLLDHSEDKFPSQWFVAVDGSEDATSPTVTVLVYLVEEDSIQAAIQAR